MKYSFLPQHNCLLHTAVPEMQGFLQNSLLHIHAAKPNRPLEYTVTELPHQKNLRTKENSLLYHLYFYLNTCETHSCVTMWGTVQCLCEGCQHMLAERWTDTTGKTSCFTKMNDHYMTVPPNKDRLKGI